MGEHKVVEQIRIEAPLETVWPLVSDPSNYSRWSPEATGIRRRSGRGDWRVGDVFVGANKARLPWVTVCTVTERAELQRFGFNVDFGPFPIAHWAYEVEPDRNATLVREIWTDRRSGPLGAPITLVGPLVGRGRDSAAHNRQSMRRTLSALKAQVEASL